MVLTVTAVAEKGNGGPGGEGDTAPPRISASFVGWLLDLACEATSASVILEMWVGSLKPLLNLLLVPIAVISLIAYAGGKALLRKTLPFGAAVSTCVLLKAMGEGCGPPWSSFQPSSAIVVVVLLMEPGITVERLLLRASERVVGTCMGCGLAVSMALLMDILGKEPLQICSFCFASFTLFGAVQAHHGVIPFVFSVMCIACAVVIFGYMTTGWAFIRSQVASVLVGEIVSLSSSLLFEGLLGDAASSRSHAHVVEIAKEMVDKAFVAIELVFVHHEAAALRAAGSSPARQFRALGRRRTFSPGVIELLAHEGEPESHQSSELGWLESQEAGLETRSRACLADMAAVEKLWGCLGFGTSSIGVPHYSAVVRQVHFLFLQACTLARNAPLNSEVRGEMRQTLDDVRFNMLAMCQPLKTFLDGLNAVVGVSKFEAEMLRMCDIVHEVHTKLESVWTVCKQQWQSSCQSSTVSTAKRIQSAVQLAKQKRTASAFCQGLDSMLAAAVNLVREHIHIGSPKATDAGAVNILRQRLEDMAGRMQAKRLESHRFDKVPEASIADVVRSLEEQRAVLAEHDARQQNAQKLFSQLEKSAQDVQPLLQRKLADLDARLEQQGHEAAQLGRLHKELKTQLESQKDVLEIRCLEKLEAQGKRMEEVSHRLEQLEDTSRSTVHQVKQADVRLQASPWILVTLLRVACRLVWLPCISAS
ncbi:unnamed protein product [Symbiodinium sp. CCMP2456]|nr:unnamed protein product [Symbiodinium sp. CCMP2456]